MDNTSRGPMAEAYMKYITTHKDIEIISRGLIVLFPEPYNPKAVAALRTKGIILENKTSMPINAEDMDEDTLVLAMGIPEKEKLIAEYDPANVYTVTEFAQGAGELIDPYGKDMDSYIEFVDSMVYWLTEVERVLKLYD